MSNDPSSLDPFTLWRQMLSQWEQGTNRLVNQASESDAFTEGMHRLMSGGLAAKKLSDDLSAKMLVALNLPSRADVEALGERLQSIEDRLIEVVQALERVGGPVAPAIAGPRRTKRPPPEEPVVASPPPAKKMTRKRSRA